MQLKFLSGGIEKKLLFVFFHDIHLHLILIIYLTQK